MIFRHHYKHLLWLINICWIDGVFAAKSNPIDKKCFQAMVRTQDRQSDARNGTHLIRLEAAEIHEPEIMMTFLFQKCSKSLVIFFWNSERKIIIRPIRMIHMLNSFLNVR